MKRLIAVFVLVVAIVATGVTAAWASTGSGGTGQVTVENVWNAEFYTFPAFGGTRTLTVDCPSGEQVINGYGLWVDEPDGSTATMVKGSATDSDTWSVSFNYSGSPQLKSGLSVNATCN